MPRKKPKFARPPQLSTLLALSAGGLVLIYAIFALFPLFLGPSLELNPPTETGEGTTIISGVTHRVSSLSINELPVPITEAGAFSIERAYPVGYTVVVIEAADRFGRVRHETLTFTTNDTSHARKEEDREALDPEGNTDLVEDRLN